MRLAEAVNEAILGGNHLVAEAGTGVGKSFAYLVPAILHAVEDQNRPETADFEENDPASRRVVISTHTIALQEQLYNKDIPFLSSILPFEFSSVLMKGRGNYLCLRRLRNVLSRTKSLLSTDEEADDLNRISEWSRDTADGSLSDLNPQPLPGVWSEVCCEQGNCMGRSCKEYKNCFYQAARRRVERASVVIVNHALLFSDLAVRAQGGSILPNYNTLIFDEAHTMEQTAGDHLGLSIGQGQIAFLLSRLWNPRTKKGLLADASDQVSDDRDLPRVTARELKEIFSLARRMVEDSQIRTEETFDDLNEWLLARPGSNGRVMEQGIIDRGLEEGLTRLAAALHSVISALSDPERKVELTAARQRVLAIKGNLTAWITQSDSEMVYWLEKTRYRRAESVRMLAAPINVGGILREMLFSKVRTAVMTSATLSAESSAALRNGETPAPFDYFLSRIGLTNARTLLLGSPFNYRENVTLIIPNNISLPREKGNPEDTLFYNALLKYIKETEGGAFVLFTSYALMRRSADAITPNLIRLGYPLLTQGAGISRSKMIEDFRKNRNSVLFGADSFWQGVDVPGDALRNVIITQLPFAVPTYPLTEARCEAITLAGGNSFREYTIPEAVIKLKQGFGRLVRKADDKGIVVILDSRVLTKNYGKTFLRALPDCKFRKDYSL
ncbi:MAG: DEAD/DEAH box helicase [Thermoguttaceae bacterium]|nr:DEAD/DEAH box helicase [Thermoguttaceae bacterium]